MSAKKMGRHPYIQMELIKGTTLNDHRSVSVVEASRVIWSLASALAHAHKRGVIHRDIKPSNVMIAGSRVVLLDFGLGIFREGDLISRITKTGERAAGGPYTAPELHDDPRLLDPRTDIYSLGALWYMMLCGRAPTAVGVDRNLSTVDDLLEGHAQLIQKCLSDLNERPSAEDVCDQFESLTDSEF
jgi:eukaryotic-like serine/threonine-protein kinase